MLWGVSVGDATSTGAPRAQVGRKAAFEGTLGWVKAGQSEATPGGRARPTGSTCPGMLKGRITTPELKSASLPPPPHRAHEIGRAVPNKPAERLTQSQDGTQNHRGPDTPALEAPVTSLQSQSSGHTGDLQGRRARCTWDTRLGTRSAAPFTSSTDLWKGRFQILDTIFYKLSE